MNIIKNLKRRIEIKMKAKSDNLNILEWLKSKKKLNRLYKDRKINSIYYDTFDLGTAKDNIDGLPIRIKYRLRKYNENNYNNAFIEFKIKNNKFNSKKIYPYNVEIDKLNFDNIFNLNNLAFKNHAHEILGLIGYKKLFPILEVEYIRSYYYFEDIVVTFDREVHFQMYNNLGNQMKVKDNSIIIEIKADESKLNSVTNFIDHLPFRISRNSKYVSGLAIFKKVSYI